MRIDRTLWLTALVAIGSALVVFPFLPGKWPSPLPEGAELSSDSLHRLKMAAARVDAACARGDIGSFEAAVTPAHQARLVRQLEAVERRLDGPTLQAFVTDREQGYAELMRRPILASAVLGERAVVAVGRREGGAQVLEFVWDGRRLRLDRSRQATAVDSAASAKTVVRDAVAR
ncbi:MAG: hypothetical protein NXI31_24955 [bacterium]|nr:hypothetical protein [bacterium]